MPSQADLQWAMYPSPYLAAVGPDATPGLVVYRLSARQRDGTQRNAQFILLEGKQGSGESLYMSLEVWSLYVEVWLLIRLNLTLV